MQVKWFLGGAAAALVVGGATFGVSSTQDSGEIAFLNPLMVSNSACGKSADAAQKRRAFFIRMASAFAEEAGGEKSIATTRTIPLANVGYDITANDEAQKLFDAGVAHMWNFNHGAAIDVFKLAQAADPDCAMCFYGEALAYGPNINAPMGDEAVAPAWAALRQARNLAGNASTKEQALIEALSKRYGPDPLVDRSTLDLAFAEAMDEVARQYPDDDFILTLAAEANMDTQAWDYWMSDGRTPKGRTDKTISLIETVLARNPQYIAAGHLYIHITEATDNPYRALDFANYLDDLSPGLGHLIHMPSHTYFRIGKFKESIAANIDAVASDEEFLASGEAAMLYEFGYYVHNVHFLLMSAFMAGDEATALDMAQKLDAKLPVEMAVAVPFAQPIKAAPYYIWARFAEPAEVLALEAPEGAPFLEAAWRYARGEAYARIGDADKVRGEAEAISKLMAEADLSGLLAANIPAPDVMKISHLTLQGRAAALGGDYDSAIEAFAEATATQENIPYTEPPFWYYPVKQTLAAMVLKKGETERAEQLFLETLAEYPNNGWVLYGLAESYSAQGDKQAKKFAERMMQDAWSGKKGALTLSKL
jgi:tetratricopeptide (TPR) repeat protein